MSRQGAISPALLTSHIKQARTLQALFLTFSKNKANVNHIHVSACWNALGLLAKTAGPAWPKDNAADLDSLVQHTLQTVRSEEVRARQLVTIAYGIARGGQAQCMLPLVETLAAAIQQSLSDCNGQELANAAWAFAKVGYANTALFASLARVIEKRAEDLNAQELANVVWAFVTMGMQDEPLLKALAKAVEWRINDFNVQGLANTAWAFGKAGFADAGLFSSLAGCAKWHMGNFYSQDIAHVSYAFAKAGQFDAELFASLARSAERCMWDFTAQGLANTAWAFAKAGQLDQQLFSAFARSIEQRIHDLNGQDIASTAWAFAKACHLDVQLFDSLAKSVKKCILGFNSQDVVNTAWAFAKVGQFDTELFTELAKSIKRQLADLSPQAMANIAWAFAKAGRTDRALFAALAKSAAKRMNEFTSEDVAEMAWAFANAGQLDAELFAALAQAAERYICDFSEEDRDNTAWAFGKAGHHTLAKKIRQGSDALAALAPSARNAVGQPGSMKCGRIVVAGGGIGGAALAVALQSKGFDVIVLEADASFDSRKQGYGLTIQKIDALQALGISLEQEDAPATSHYIFSPEGNILGVYGEAFKTKQERRTSSSSAGRFIHIPRQMLRAKILEHIQPEVIRWSSKLKEFSCQHLAGKEQETESRHSGVSVTLMDGTVLDAALLVGADGIFSTVRRQMNLPGDRLNYLGLVVALGMVRTKSLRSQNDVAGDEGSDAVACDLPQRRIFETVDGVTRFYSMPFTSTMTMWQLSFPYKEKLARKLGKDTAALKKEILRRCGSWHEPIPSILRSTPLDCMSGYPVYDRDLLDPSSLRKADSERVTLLGDAAHPMCPFRAQGANQALSDAVLLAEILEDGVRQHGPVEGIDRALPVFEKKMLSRSSRMVVASREKAKELHSSLALRPARKVQRDSGLDMPEIIRLLCEEGIGADCASDPRGLDALVGDVIAKVSGDLADADGHHVTRLTKKRKVASMLQATSPPVLSAPSLEDSLLPSATKTQRRRSVKSSLQAETSTAECPDESTQTRNSDWWKALVFDGYTGAEWEAWYSG